MFSWPVYDQSADVNNKAYISNWIVSKVQLLRKTSLDAQSTAIRSIPLCFMCIFRCPHKHWWRNYYIFFLWWQSLELTIFYSYFFLVNLTGIFSLVKVSKPQMSWNASVWLHISMELEVCKENTGITIYNTFSIK